MATASPGEEDQREQVERRLKSHSETVVAACRRWLESAPQRPQRVGYILIEYRLSGAAAFYLADERSIIKPLVLPEELETVREELESHLGPENWKLWEALREGVNSHLAAVAGLWNEIGDRMTLAGHEAGLFPSSRPTEAPVDTCWPALFVEAIWKESAHYQATRAHLWEDARVVEDSALVPMRHTEDTVQTFIFAGNNMVRAQSKAPLEAMKRAWETEASRVAPVEGALMAQRSRLEEDAEAFRGLLRKFDLDHPQGWRLPDVCPKCGPLLDELSHLTV